MNEFWRALFNPLLGAFLGAIVAIASGVLLARLGARRRVAGVLAACREHVQREREGLDANLAQLERSSDALAGLIAALETRSEHHALEDRGVYGDALARAMNVSVEYFVPGRWTQLLGADVAFVEPRTFHAVATLESLVEFVNRNASDVLSSVRGVVGRLGHGSLAPDLGALRALDAQGSGAVLAALRGHLVNLLLYLGLVAALRRQFEATATVLETGGAAP